MLLLKKSIVLLELCIIYNVIFFFTIIISSSKIKNLKLILLLVLYRRRKFVDQIFKETVINLIKRNNIIFVKEIKHSCTSYNFIQNFYSIETTLQKG